MVGRFRLFFACLHQKFELFLKYQRIVIIETHDHPRPGKDVVPLYFADAFDRGAQEIDPFSALLQGRRPGAFDADKDRAEICLLEKLEDVFALRNVDSQFRRKTDGIIIFFSELDQPEKDSLRKFRVSQEIGVRERNARYSEPPDGFDLLHNLVKRLGARHTSVGNDDIAKFACIRASPACLQVKGVIPVAFDEVVARNRRPGNVDFLRLSVQPFGHSHF